MSNSGPSGRGVNRLSQAPQDQHVPGASPANCLTSADLPTPASPAASTRRPSPWRASLAYSASDASDDSRSSSVIPLVSGTHELSAWQAGRLARYAAAPIEAEPLRGLAATAE